MPKPSNRDKILSEGLRLVHERGFAAASVRDIAHAAQVPLGSFTNHFASKEAFGLEILDIYAQNNEALIATTLHNETLAPLARIGAYVDAVTAKLCDNEMRRGCLFGNFSAEIVEQCEPMRLRLIEIFEQMRAAIGDALAAAIAAGELPKAYDCFEAAGFIYGAMQGAILMAKTTRSVVPMARFRRQLFEKILR